MTGEKAMEQTVGIKIQRFSELTWTEEYGTHCSRSLSGLGLSNLPFGSMTCMLPPGHAAKKHMHHERELFLIVQGQGVVEGGAERLEVNVGDVVAFEALTQHTIANRSETDALMYVSLYWEDLRALATLEGADVSGGPARVLITATPPTPNGDLHLGHLSGPFVAADIYKRYQRMRGRDAYYISGADDHQSYVPLKATQTKSSPRAVARKYSDSVQSTLRAASVEVDHFGEPSLDAHHTKLATEVFVKLLANGDIRERTVMQPYCEPCARFVSEAHIRGRCPHCRASCDGNACEQCGRPNDCTDMLEAGCRQCGTTPVMRETRKLYFALAPHEAFLRDYAAGVSTSPHMHQLLHRMLADGLPEIAVSHHSDWGIPVPVPGYEDQRMYVWFEMAPGYLAAAQELADKEGIEGGWRALWASDETRIVQFFGFDNGYYHYLLFPAVLHAYEPDIRVPSAMVVNEFYRLDGSKFSTSRAHAVWAGEFLSHEDADAVRYYLGLTRPEHEQTNFSREEYARTIQHDLVELVGGWLKALGERVHERFAGVAPEPGSWLADHKAYYAQLKQTLACAEAGYSEQSFSMREVARAIRELARRASEFGQGQSALWHSPGSYEEYRTAIALELASAQLMAQIAAPLMPRFAEKLAAWLGCSQAPAWHTAPAFLPKGTRVAQHPVTFFGASATATSAAEAL